MVPQSFVKGRFLSMQPILPFWFKQRQGKMEPAGDDLYRLTAPNSGEAFVGVRPVEHGQWHPVMRTKADGPDQAAPNLAFDSPQDAWDAAFEIYRVHIVV